MAQLSKTKRKTTKLRRKNTQLRKGLKRTLAAYGRNRAILLAVLGQSGGKVIVTKGTLEQVAENMKILDYAVEQTTTENEYMVSLVTTIAPSTEVPAVPDGAECVINGTDVVSPVEGV